MNAPADIEVLRAELRRFDKSRLEVLAGAHGLSAWARDGFMARRAVAELTLTHETVIREAKALLDPEESETNV